MRITTLLFCILSACATGGDPEYVTPNQAHPATNLSEQFYPSNGMPTGSKGDQEFFSKKCSPRSSSNHVSTTEYFCDQR
ncbi:MAG: hypothetical protein ABL958_10250 [Bdellovibrionia bacterium]